MIIKANRWLPFVVSLLAMWTCQANEVPIKRKVVTDNARTVLTGIEQVSDSHDLTVIYAALSLQELFVKQPGYAGESLAKYQLERPVVKQVTSNLGRSYVLVAFPARQLDDKGTAFTIFQRCKNKSLLIVERGFYMYLQKLVDSFIEASKDSSADYFERDGCRLLVGDEY